VFLKVMREIEDIGDLDEALQALEAVAGDTDASEQAAP
jgi:hypothetical protein